MAAFSVHSPPAVTTSESKNNINKLRTAYTRPLRRKVKSTILLIIRLRRAVEFGSLARKKKKTLTAQHHTHFKLPYRVIAPGLDRQMFFWHHNILNKTRRWRIYWARATRINLSGYGFARVIYTGWRVCLRMFDYDYASRWWWRWWYNKLVATTSGGRYSRAAAATVTFLHVWSAAPLSRLRENFSNRLRKSNNNVQTEETYCTHVRVSTTHQKRQPHMTTSHLLYFQNVIGLFSIFSSYY